MNIIPFDAEHCAKAMLDHLLAQSAEDLSFAIPGGRSPGKVLEPFAKHCPTDLLEKLHLLWVDERCVPLNHGDRNDVPTLAAWQAGGPLPKNIHPMPAEMEDLDLATKLYNDILVQKHFKTGIHQCLLGIGEDGHFASLFPNHSGLNVNKDVFFLDTSPKPPPRRLSFSLSYIFKSLRIDVLVFGVDKGSILKKCQQGPQQKIPISLLVGHNNIYFHLDQEAMTSYGE
jgi:6-phosphogluconolactonase